MNMDPKWFGSHLAYTMSKYGMSMTVIGQSNQLKNHGMHPMPSGQKLLLPQQLSKIC
ncbi:MAG: hypothetical protein CM15mP65_24620 [Crocinitomicaceae bacterium]|nr:MAG: hypothetical protein CM15mP65_24620 [Crocinitomicaceae bacterium]